MALRAWVLTWFAYATYYAGRKGFSVAKKTLATDVGLSERTLGAIDTAYLSAYSLGQLLNGLLGDRVGARRLIGFGLLGSALCCTALGASSTALAFGVAFCVNGLFQATGWPGTTLSMAEWTTPRNRGTVMAFWSTCYQVGGVVANALCGYLLIRFGWRSAFLGPALLLVLMAGLILMALPSRARNAGTTQSAVSPEDVAASAALSAEARRRALRSTVLWSYGSSYFFIKFVRYALLFWLPYYLSTALGYAADVAANVSSAFEVGGVVGVIALGVLSDRWRSVSRATLSAASLFGLALALYGYTLVAHWGVLPSALALALVGALLFGPDALLSGAAAQDAGGPRAASTATGLVNGIGSLGAIVEGLAIPTLSAHFGWRALFPALVLSALAAVLALIPAMLKPARPAT